MWFIPYESYDLLDEFSYNFDELFSVILKDKTGYSWSSCWLIFTCIMQRCSLIVISSIWILEIMFISVSTYILVPWKYIFWVICSITWIKLTLEVDQWVSTQFEYQASFPYLRFSSVLIGLNIIAFWLVENLTCKNQYCWTILARLARCSSLVISSRSFLRFLFFLMGTSKSSKYKIRSNFQVK